MPFPCPYCNAAVRVTADRKPQCPRCGETVRVPDDVPPDAGGPAPAIAPTPLRRRNKAVGLGVLGLMVTMAAIGLAYALATKEFRRANDNKNLLGKAGAVPAVPPGELAGLAYLPADVQAVAGIAVAQALETESGKVLLKAIKITGFTPEEIDHVVAGADLRSLRLTVVVRTRRPIDLAKVRAALKADRSEERNGRTLYKGKLPFRDSDGYITFPDPSTLVAALSAEAFDPVPKSADAGIERMAPPVRDLVAKLPVETPAWLVARKDPADATLAIALALAPIPMELKQGLLKLTSLSVHAAEHQDRLEVKAVATGLDDSHATAVRDALHLLEGDHWTVRGVDPLTVTWSETVAGLKQLLAE